LVVFGSGIGKIVMRTLCDYRGDTGMRTVDEVVVIWLGFVDAHGKLQFLFVLSDPHEIGIDGTSVHNTSTSVAVKVACK